MTLKLERMIGGTCYVGTADKNGDGSYAVQLFRKSYDKHGRGMRGRKPELAHLPAYDMLRDSESSAAQWIKDCFSVIRVADAVHAETVVH